MLTTVIDKLAGYSSSIHSWSIDSPGGGQSPKVNERGLYVQGWVLTTLGKPAEHIVIVMGEDEQTPVLKVPFGGERPDVIERRFGVTSEGHPQIKCGFWSYLPADTIWFRVGAVIDQRPEWLCEVRIQSSPVESNAQPLVGVLSGSDGWLFLDNDTNRSVDQHTGKALLDADKIEGWLKYFKDTRALASRIGARRHAVLVAPSKEQVLPERYPYARGRKNILEQVLSCSESIDHIVDAGRLLLSRPDKESCLIKTDTHWTDHGARVVVMALLAELGFSTAEAEVVFADDRYHTMRHHGDLGIKCKPPVSAPTEFLLAPPVDSDAVFDNQLPNMGRVLVYACPDAPWSETFLMFGASSSHVMLKYLKRLFRRVVLVHSAANVDPAVVEHEKPDVLVFQTTARFMIEVPHTAYNLNHTVASKLKEADEPLRNRVAEVVSKGCEQPADQYYFNMLVGAV